ncbi:MAG: aminodeoxychorismate lyase [Jatrophihabitantaceae bacterium]
MVDPDAPVLAADDLGLTRGDGCFEATRVLTGTDLRHRVDHLEQHLDRLDRSAAGLDLPAIDRGAWCLLIEQALAAWTRPGEAMLKLMLSRGRESVPAGPVTGILSLTPTAAQTLRQRRDGLAVIALNRGYAAQAFTEARWLLGGVKTLSYAVNVAATREAGRRGADDVLFTSADGYLLEAPTATLVWATGDRLLSTPLDGTGVLASITQQALFEAAEKSGLNTGYQLARPGQVASADGAWLVSSGRGVATIRSLDGQPLPVDEQLSSQLSALAGF